MYAFYLLFLLFLHWLELPRTVLNKSSVSINPWLVPSLGNKNIQPSTINYSISCRCFVDYLYQVEGVPVYPYFSERFCHEGVFNFFKCFSCIIDMIIWFLFIILLMWWIILNDVWILNQSWIPGINLTGSSFIIYFMYCWMLNANMLWRIIVSVFMRNIGLKFSLFCAVFAWFWYQVNTSFITWIKKYSFFFCFLE